MLRKSMQVMVVDNVGQAPPLNGNHTLNYDREIPFGSPSDRQ